MKTQFYLFALMLGIIHNAAPQSGIPEITGQPQSYTNVVGSTVTLSVEATGTPPLFYQWRRFSNVTGQTNDILVIASLQSSNAGNYTVVITNAQGAVTSAIAFVRILVPAAIISQPADQIMTVGAAATFTVTAIGTALAYQWRFNDANLVGKTSTSLVLPNVQLTNAGNYSVVVTNSFGSVTSQIAGLAFTTVHRFGPITAHPDRSISGRLEGVVPRLFAPYYDIYPLDVSTNLVDWSPLDMLQRTNAVFDALTYFDPDATNVDKRFYRTSTNFLITPFPKLSGPYQVGSVARLMTDPSRIRNTAPTSSSFMVTFWYPGQPRAGLLPVAYVEKEITVIPPASGSPSYWDSPATVEKLVAPAQPDIPFATNQVRYPVLLFSHGMGGHRRQNSDLLLELASHGYVVVAMDHKDAFAAVFPSGQIIRGAPGTPCEQLNSSVMEYRTHDLWFLMDQLSQLNTNDLLLAGRLDLERIGAIGKSMGGMAVAEIGRIDPRCKAVVLLDAGYTLEMPPELVSLGLGKPFLSMSSTITSNLPATCSRFGPWLSSSLALFTNAISDAFWCQIQDSSHNGFSDKASLINDTPGTGTPTAISKAQSVAIRACTLSFFNKYLKNQDDHLMDNPAAVHTNIINCRSK